MNPTINNIFCVTKHFATPRNYKNNFVPRKFSALKMFCKVFTAKQKYFFKFSVNFSGGNCSWLSIKPITQHTLWDVAIRSLLHLLTEIQVMLRKVYFIHVWFYFNFIYCVTQFVLNIFTVSERFEAKYFLAENFVWFRPCSCLDKN